MANKSFKTISGTIEITNNLQEYNSKLQVEWTGSSWRNKPSIAITHGDTSFPQDAQFGAVVRQQNLFKDTGGNDGFKMTATSGASHTTNYEVYGNGRWMSASVFYGIGFRCYQSSSQTHGMYLKKYGLIFANRDNTQYRVYGINTGATQPREGDRDIRLVSTSNVVNTIRNWGPSWLFQGILIHVATNGGGGSDYSELQIFNMKVGSKMSTLGGQYRYLPAGKRPYEKRNAHINNVGFQTLFV